MMRIRRSADRGHFNHGWLDTYHSFSFADYHDPDHMGFRALRVINEDRVAPGAGFDLHPHRDMEIVTVVLAGALQHRDSLGHSAVLKPAEVQRITAGRGILHSEFNPSATEPVHLLQIWLFPRERGLTPDYRQQAFPATADGVLQTLVSPDGRAGSLVIQQDAALYRGVLQDGQSLAHRLAHRRHAWLQLIRGGVRVADDAATATSVQLTTGDGLAVTDAGALTVAANAAAEFLLFDLA
ncbi:MAG: pirin family protein [Phycisphaerae bacterium]